MTWAPGSFSVAHAFCPVEVKGYVFGGLGLHLGVKASPKGRRLARWSLTHLNTGHRVATLHGDVLTVFPVAHEIATCSDWDAFASLSGWQNTDPRLSEKIHAIAMRFPHIIDVAQGRGGSEEVASKIALERA